MKNAYEIRGDTTVIFIKRKNGDVYEFLIDTEDLSGLIEDGGSWCVDIPYNPKDLARKPYAIRNAAREDGVRQFVKLHRVLTDAPEGTVVDHIDGNTLDNRRCNLRVTDQFINAQNVQGPSRNNNLGILNVHYDGSRGKWTASVMRNGLAVRKRFSSKEDATTAADLMRRGMWEGKKYGA